MEHIAAATPPNKRQMWLLDTLIRYCVFMYTGFLVTKRRRSKHSDISISSQVFTSVHTVVLGLQSNPSSLGSNSPECITGIHVVYIYNPDVAVYLNVTNSSELVG